MASSITRMTGLSGLLDTDSLVQATMKAYQTKADTYYKETKVYEYKQELYRGILNSSQSFYNKYLVSSGSNNLVMSQNWSTIKMSSSNEDKVSAKALGGAQNGSYRVLESQRATAAKVNLGKADEGTGVRFSDKIQEAIDTGNANTISIKYKKLNTDTNAYEDKYAGITLDDKLLDKNGDLDQNALAKRINAILIGDGAGYTASYSEFSKGVVIQSDNLGEDQKLEVSLVKVTGSNVSAPVYTSNGQGQDAKLTLINQDNEEYTYVGNKNTVTVDNIEYTINGSASAADAVKISSTTDVEDTKKRIISFVNDYNQLVSDINTKLWEKYDKSYQPLTDDEKKDMSEDQIKQWETKSKTGLLHSDTELRSVVNAMKSIMSENASVLKQIGITPVADYTTKSGMLTIDENKLESALKNDGAGVKKLFTDADSGIITKLSKSLYDNCVSSTTSSLIKKVGIENGSMALTNDYTKLIDKRKTTYEDMLDDLTTRENNLYTKYASIESTLQKLNSQQTYLSNMLGTN